MMMMMLANCIEEGCLVDEEVDDEEWSVSVPSSVVSNTEGISAGEE